MKESLLTDIFWHAGFFLILSALVIPVLRYFKTPTALGYLLAGIALGPFGLANLAEYMPFIQISSLENTDHVKVLAELGIVLLLFVIGLELTPRRLWQMRNLVFGLGSAQVMITASAIGGVALLWGNSASVSVLLGLSLALSSTALVIQWLQEQKLFVTNMGRTSFSILLLQDLAVIPILLLLTILSTGGNGNIVEFVSISVLKMVVSGAVIYFIGKMTLKPLFIFANRHGGAEVFMALSLLVIVGSASIANMAGLSMALGAFIAGLLLADTEYRHEISSLIVPFKSMLLGIFFFSFGMSINLTFIAEKPFWLFASVIGLMTMKATIIFVLCKLWKQSTSVSVESAILLSQAGEFGLLVVGSALTLGLMEQNVGQFMLITVGITMMATPFIAILSRKIGGMIERNSAQGNTTEITLDIEGHAVLFGYGRIGTEIASTLCKEGLKIIAFEKDIARVQHAQAKSYPVYLGSAIKKSTIEAAHLDKALCAIITIDDAAASKQIVASIRALHPHIPLIVRAHNAADFKTLDDMESVYAIPEHIIVSGKIAEKALFYCDCQSDDNDDNEEKIAA